MENNNSQLKKLQYIIVSCMFAFAIILVVSIFSFVSLGKARRANAKYDEYIASLEKQESDLESSIENIDDAYLEEQTRNYLGMIQDGETKFIFEFKK